MKIEKLKMTRMHNLFIITLSAMCVACGGRNQGNRPGGKPNNGNRRGRPKKES